MPISDRIESTIEKWRLKWGDQLGKWLGRFIASGILGFTDKLGEGYASKLKAVIASVSQAKELPPELKPIFDEMLSPTGESGALGLDKAALSVISGAMDKLLGAILVPLGRWAQRQALNQRIGGELVLQAALRGLEMTPGFQDRLMEEGFSPAEQKLLFALKQVRFPSEIVGPIWLRDKEKYAALWSDVKSLGVDDERIAILKELAYQMPSVRDVVGFLAHEVFEPKMIAKYGLDDEWGELDKTLFEKVGLKEPMALNYWRDHWTHASWSQVRDMLHRDILTEQDVYDWFRLVEIPPYWRKGLTKTMWDVPGRIEVRMMAQLGLVDKAFIMDILKKDGLAEEYRDIVADMNLVRGIRTDIQTRYTKKWIDSEGVKAELAKSGLSPQVADRLYKWIVTNTKPDRTAAEKDLTVAQICKAVKRGDIPWDDGIDRLMAQGYDEEEADLIMTQSVEVVEVEPTTELNVSVDTIRRQRRQRLMTRDQEISELLVLGIDTGLATAYADNDDMRLVKEVAAKPPEVIPEYLTDDGKVKVETIRLSRRQRRISRSEEITSLINLEMSSELAIAYADNDDLRLVKETTGGA